MPIAELPGDVLVALRESEGFTSYREFASTLPMEAKPRQPSQHAECQLVGVCCKLPRNPLCLLPPWAVRSSTPPVIWQVTPVAFSS